MHTTIMTGKSGKSNQASDEWVSLEGEIRRIVAESGEPFSWATVSQAGGLVNLLRERVPVPEVGRGYWSTIRFIWSNANCEVEVFEDHIEIYRFYDGRTDIENVVHTVGEPFPDTLLAKLPSG